MLIFHHNDLDGRCAAAIMGRADRDEFIEVDYKDEIPIEKCRGREVAVLDFSFHPQTMARVIKVATCVVWCDHHATAKDYPYQHLPGVRDFEEKGRSGCECTWNYVHPSTPYPRAVQLIGDYDSWRLEHQPQCFELTEGLKLHDTHPKSNLWRELFRGERTAAIRRQGKAAIAYRDSYCADMARRYGYETQLGGHNAFAMNVYRFGSKAFGAKFNKYPICIAYICDGRNYTVSLYSETVDVSEIAKFFGGGGHKGAAGFVCVSLPF